MTVVVLGARGEAAAANCQGLVSTSGQPAVVGCIACCLPTMAWVLLGTQAAVKCGMRRHSVCSLDMLDKVSVN